MSDQEFQIVLAKAQQELENTPNIRALLVDAVNECLIEDESPALTVEIVGMLVGIV